MCFDREMMKALEADGEKLRQLTGEDHGPVFLADDPYPGLAPCPHCFESCGYVVEFGNDWNSGPWSNQTNIPCKVCNGTGNVECEPATLADLENEAADAGWETDYRHCDMGVGCDEVGVCYAEAHNQPERCPSYPRRKAEAPEIEGGQR